MRIRGTKRLNKNLSTKMTRKLEEEKITLKIAQISDLENIIELYKERMQWFKDNEINQWSRYLKNHPKSEFREVIEKENYFILIKDNQIIAGFELSERMSFWEDKNTKAYYIYKIVTKVGLRKLGEIIFDICRDLAKQNGKNYLRLECLSTNEKLNQIYENYHFELVKQGIGYYPYNLRECEI